MRLHDLIEEWDTDVRSADPLGFPGYAAALDAADGESVRTGLTDAGYALVEGRFDVMGGSMGEGAGEKVVRAFRRATDRRLPVVCLTRSGGARLQEGMVALAQLARTTDAVRAHDRTGLQSLAVLDAPTTGGVFVSYASTCQLRAAVVGATIGFAGPRVVLDLLGVEVGDTSHTAEAAWRSGLVDALVGSTEEGRAWVEAALGQVDLALLRRDLPTPPIVAEGGAWGQVLRARAQGRPTGVDWASTLCSSWVELRGPDPVVRAGLATMSGRRVVVVATDRYADDGRIRPPGYRLARRAFDLAADLRLPVLTLVDTPGADPSPASEAAGIAGEIARTFAAMGELPTPSVAVCVGEGGSGGALAIAHADRLLMLDGAIFSVIGPEGAASILDRDPGQAPVRAAQLALTSAELVGLGVADAAVGESPDDVRAAVLKAIDEALPGERSARLDGLGSG